MKKKGLKHTQKKKQDRICVINLFNEISGDNL